MSLFSRFEGERAAGPFTLLTVCTGNICRSPLTETLLRKVLYGLPVVAHSAGTHALVGRPMTEQNQVIARELGVADGSEHRARLLTRTMVGEADLVLALSREHRAAAVELLPRASRRVYTLREFARLAESANALEFNPSTGESQEDRMRDAIEEIAQLRGTMPGPEDPLDLDVVDPFKQSDEVYVHSAGQITPAVNIIGSLLRRVAQEGGAR